MHPSIRVFTLLILVAGANSHAQAAEPPTLERFLVYLDGHHVGSERWEHADGDTRFVREQVIQVKQRDGRATMRLRLEVHELRAGTFTLRQRTDAGPASNHGEATITAGRLRVGGVDAGRLPAGTVLPQDLARALSERADSPAGVLVVLDPDNLLPVTAGLSSCFAPGAVPTGERCVRLTLRGRHEDWRFDTQGQVASVERDFAGLPLVLRRCLSDCDRVVEAPFDAVGHLIVESPFRIPGSASQRELRYVLARGDGQPLLIPATGDQRVARDGARAIVSVCRDCGDASEETPATLAPFLRPNTWIQSDDPAVRRLAARVGGRGKSVDERMRRSVVVLADRLKGYPGYIAYADAAQVLRLGHADCTGYAVTLAALARAQGIPARVVAGMAYADRFSGRSEVFSPHAWVQAWDGTRWRSYDAALLDFDSTHLALAVGDGNPAAMIDAFLQLSQLRIERLGAVKAP